MHIVALGKGFPLLCQMLRIQGSLKPGVGVPSRLHVRETLSEVAFSEDTDASAESAAEPDLPNYFQPDKNLHPVYQQALLERFAPFRSFGSVN